MILVKILVGEVICSLGDCHIYEVHFDAVKEQLTRNPFEYNLPKLVLNKDIKNIDDFTFDDIKIEKFQKYYINNNRNNHGQDCIDYSLLARRLV